MSKWNAQTLALVFAILIQGTLSFAADWKAIDEFTPGFWTVESWPMSENSRLNKDTSRQIEGSSSWKTTVQSNGWGGGFRLVGLPPQQPPKTSISLSVFVIPGPNAQGAPSCKLEVRSISDKPLSAGEVTLTPGKWNTISLPASSINEPWKDLLIVIANNNSTGTFNLWFDNLKVDQLVFEDFEQTTSQDHKWKASSAQGKVSLEGVSINCNSKEQNGLKLIWSGTKKAELKKSYDKSLDLSSNTRWRLTTKDTSPSPTRTVGLWIYDGMRGSWLGAAHVEKTGDCTIMEFDIKAAYNDTNLALIREVSITVQDDATSSGSLQFSKLENLAP